MNIKAALKKNMMLIVLILVYIFFTIMTHGKMFEPLQFNALITQNAYVYILAAGMLMCMLTGGNIDLACGSFVCLLGACGGLFMVIYSMNTGLALVLTLVIGIVYGCILGYLIAYVNIPPWIATLAGYLAFRGLGTSILSSNSKTGSIAPFPESFLNLFSGKIFKTKLSVFNTVCMGVAIVAAILVVLVIFSSRASKLKKGYVADSLLAASLKAAGGVAAILLFGYKLAKAGGIPTVLIWVVAVVLFYAFVTGKTTIGRHFYVVGGNIEAARMSGVNTKRIMFAAYLNMAVLTVIAAWTVMARFQAANSQAGTYFEMDAISACVVGGVSASGGAGTIMGMVIGATLIGVINLGMSLMGLDTDLQKIVKGVVLLAAVAFDIVSKKRER
ncbi:MAG: sugar ABC transporter permease [Clostridia bacterium]|nr:sugar ABC transporter permease [Clostridia bacterium]